jgi:hypothetical protein
MPHTVPNSPMNGAVEPVVARNGSCVCSALPMRATPRAMTLSIHSWSGTSSVMRLSWCSAASMASEAIALKTLPLPVSLPTPVLMLSAAQKFLSASVACLSSRRCSHHFVKMMNRE